MVHALLNAGLDVNEAATPEKGRLPRGSTPLTLAIENGHFTLATSLLEAGANPNDTRTGFSRYIFFPGSGNPAVEMAQTISRRPMARGS